MILSEERQGHLAKLIIDSIWNDDLVDYTDDESAMRIARKAIATWVGDQSNVDENVRQKIASLKRTLLEGSPEWDVMYAKYYDEEMRKYGSK